MARGLGQNICDVISGTRDMLEDNNIFTYIHSSKPNFHFLWQNFYNIDKRMSASESKSSATLKENNSEMYNRECDLEDEEHSSEEAKTLGNSNVEAY